MGIVKVDTALVIDTAGQVSKINSQIREEYRLVQSAFDLVNNSWHGRASESGKTTLSAIKARYYNQRFEVLETYVKSLNQLIAPSYEQTESNNTNLAKQFK